MSERMKWMLANQTVWAVEYEKQRKREYLEKVRVYGVDYRKDLRKRKEKLG